MIEGTEKPIRSCKLAGRYNQATKKILAKIFLPQKISKSKILTLPPPATHPELKLQKVLKSISYCELKE